MLLFTQMAFRYTATANMHFAGPLSTRLILQTPMPKTGWTMFRFKLRLCAGEEALVPEKDVNKCVTALTECNKCHDKDLRALSKEHRQQHALPGGSEHITMHLLPP